jgi:hypothetical protein
MFESLGSDHRDCIGYSCAQTGHKFVIVDLTVKNAGQKTFNVNPFDFKLSSSDGVSRDYDSATYSLPRAMQDGDVDAGGALEGELAFEIPASAYPTKLCFDDGYTSHCTTFTYG